MEHVLAGFVVIFAIGLFPFGIYLILFYKSRAERRRRLEMIRQEQKRVVEAQVARKKQRDEMMGFTRTVGIDSDGEKFVRYDLKEHE